MARPSKYDKEYHCKKAYRLSLLGAIDTELADFFEVAVSTIAKWKVDYIEFSDALKAGKHEADSKVAKSLFKRANGFSFKEKTYEKGVLTKVVEKQVPPDTTAQIFWLKNRKPEVWRDKQEIEHKGINLTISRKVVK